MMIIDAHAHMGYLSSFYIPDVGVKHFLKVMDNLGIDMVLSTSLAMLYGEIELGLDESIRAYDESNGRIRSYIYYSPQFTTSEYNLLKNNLKKDCFVGIKIHPSICKVYADDELYVYPWRWAEEANIPILTHTWDISDTNPVQKYSFPKLFEKHIKRCPYVNIILGHAGGRYKGHLAAVDLVCNYNNVYIDLSGDSYPFRFIEWLTGKVPCERILFGTDMTWIDPRTHLGRILNANISKETKHMILGENAQRLFNIT